MEKLLPRSRHLFPGDAAPSVAEDREKQDGLTKAQQPVFESTAPVKQQQNDSVGSAREALNSTAEEDMNSACSALGSPATGERLFVFRDPPESCDSVDVPKRKRKRNFLNLKKGSVAPTTLP